MPWGMAVVGGWDAAALAFLMSVWPIIIRADSATPRRWQNAPTRSKAAGGPACANVCPVAEPGIDVDTSGMSAP